MTATPPPTNAGRTFVPEPLTPTEVEALLAAIPTRSAGGTRLRALVAVLYGSGLRLGEALALYPRDLELDEGFIRVRHGKGDGYRTVALVDARATETLARWLDRRPALGLNGRHPVFATYETGNLGKPLQQRYVRLALARAGHDAEIEKRVHPHGLRHSLATRLARGGAPLAVIQSQLGHDRATTTARYIQRLGAAETVEAMRRVDLWNGAGSEDVSP